MNSFWRRVIYRCLHYRNACNLHSVYSTKYFDLIVNKQWARTVKGFMPLKVGGNISPEIERKKPFVALCNALKMCLTRPLKLNLRINTSRQTSPMKSCLIHFAPEYIIVSQTAQMKSRQGYTLAEFLDDFLATGFAFLVSVSNLSIKNRLSRPS